MRIVVTGSLAYDYIMNFPGKFAEHILPDKVHQLSVSFLVDSMKRLRGGTAGNIAFTLALLGEKPRVISAAGSDFGEYVQATKSIGVDFSSTTQVIGEFTASCFINTDQVNNQIVAFYPGAAVHARDISLEKAGLEKGDWVIISPTDPESMMRHTAECKKLGANYIFDPGKQAPRLTKEQILTGLDGCSVLIGNDYEFGMMARMTGLTEEQLINSAPVSIMTLGEKGARIYTKGKGHVEIPVAKVAAVLDPTGAGDAFLAGIAFGLAHKLSHEVSGRLASLCSAYTIELKGCQEHTFTKAAFLKRYSENFGASSELEAALK